MRILLSIIALLVSLSMVEAAQKGIGSSGGAGFSCDVNTLDCSCEGDAEGADCKAMAKNCKTGSWEHCFGTTCYCKMKASRKNPSSKSMNPNLKGGTYNTQ